MSHESAISDMNVALLPTDEQPSRKKFTADDVMRMVDAGILREDDNIELIEGDLVMMAAKYAPHENIKHALVLALARYVGEGLYVSVESSLRLAHDIIVEPDIAVIAREVFTRAGRALAEPRPEDIHLFVEIADSRLAYDRQVKARLYARHGVGEFWVIDANERITWIHTGPSGDGWKSIVERSADDTLTASALPGFAVRLADID